MNTPFDHIVCNSRVPKEKYALSYWLLVFAMLIVSWGCSTSGSYRTGTGNQLVPANSTGAQKLSIGQLANEAGLNDKTSPVRKLVESALDEARESEWQKEEAFLLETLLDMDSTGLNVNKPVHVWARMKVELSEKATKFDAKYKIIQDLIEAKTITQEQGEHILNEYRVNTLKANDDELNPNLTQFLGVIAEVKNEAVVESLLTRIITLAAPEKTSDEPNKVTIPGALIGAAVGGAIDSASGFDASGGALAGNAKDRAATGALGNAKDQKSVRIDLFENKTLEPRLVVAVQRALKHRLQQDGYTIESDNSADLVVTGEITEFLRNGISYQPGDVLTVQDYSLQLRAKLTVTERATGEAVINQDITGSTTVRVGNDFNAGQRQAVPLIADELAVQAADLITTGNSSDKKQTQNPVQVTDKEDSKPKDESKTQAVALPWIQHNGYKVLVSSLEASGYGVPEGSTQSMLIALNKNTLVFILAAPMPGSGPDPEELLDELLDPETRSEEERKLLDAANEKMLAQLDTKQSGSNRVSKELNQHLSQSADFGTFASLGFLDAFPQEMLRDEEPFDTLLNFLTLDQLKQIKANFSLDSRPGILQANLSAAVPTIGADWQGKGLDSTLLNAIPADATVIAGLSLGKGLLNKDSLNNLLPIIENIDFQDRFSILTQPANEAEACIIDDALSGLGEWAQEFAAEKLLNMFEGNAFIAITLPPEDPEAKPSDAYDGRGAVEGKSGEEPISFNQEAAGPAVAPEEVGPPFGMLAGFKIADVDLFTQIKGALRAAGILREAEANGFHLVHRGNLAFICTKQYKEDLEKDGRLKKSLGGSARRQLQDKAFVLWTDYKTMITNGEAIGWDRIFGEYDPEGQAIESTVNSLLASLRFNSGRAETEIQLNLKDPKTSAIRQWIEAIIKGEASTSSNSSERPWGEGGGFNFRSPRREDR